MSKTRDVYGIIWKNFINSLKPRQIRGNKIGKDTNGNTYFEIPADRSVGRRKASRWFDPPIKDDFQNEMPAEWEAWLRNRRIDAPTEEEIAKNQAIMEMKKVNAARLEQERIKELEGTDQAPSLAAPRGMSSYPKYPDYEYGDGTKRN